MKNVLIILMGIIMIPGLLITAHAELINLAPDGTATQSSDHGYADASLAIDGNTSGDFWDGSVTHTNYEAAWWQVDLGNEFNLDSIMIWNRTDYRPNRLSNFHVSVMDSEMNEVWGQDYFTNGATFNPSMEIQLPDNIIAQFVEIQLYNINWLSLAEVEVFELVEIEVYLVAIEVYIDIKPDSSTNPINRKSKGNTPVAILSDPDFNAEDVDISTVIFAGAYVYKEELEDIDEDGLLDLILHFKTQELDLEMDDTEVCLNGETFGGKIVEGCDNVRVVK